MEAEREALKGAATAFAAAPENQAALRSLCEAAWKYAQARQALASGAKAQARAEEKGPEMPFGRNKGKPLSACDLKSVQWLAGVMEERLADPERERFAAQNRALLDACQREIERRG